jgi:hypothetical protein
MKLKEVIEFVKEEIDFHKRHPELLIALLIAGSTYFIFKELNR